MEAQRKVLRFLMEGAQRWNNRFPALHKRAQWHIGSHLCVHARSGAAVGELSGMVRQIFLLDDATVRERINEFCSLELCTIDPQDSPISARTIVIPSESLLLPFDQYLRDVAGDLHQSTRAFGGVSRPAPASELGQGMRQLILNAVSGPRETVIGRLEKQLESAGLSRARLLDLRRNLLSVSHWTILLATLAQRHEASSEPDDGILADEVGAALLSLIRQNFQTTRDHIAYLLQLGVLERRPGRALRIGLADSAARVLDDALLECGSQLAAIGGELAAAESEVERTGTLRIDDADRVSDTHVLIITHPTEPARIVSLNPEETVIGRSPGSAIVLPAIEVSRAHCRISLEAGQAQITDLNSTNGTFVDGKRITGKERLKPAAILQIGPYRLEYRRPKTDPEATIQMTRVVSRAG